MANNNSSNNNSSNNSGNNSGNNNYNKGTFVWLGVLIILIIGLMAVTLLTVSGGKTNPKYSDVVAYFERNEVKSLSLDLGTGQAEIMLRQDDEKISYKVPYVALFTETVDPIIREHNLTYEKGSEEIIIYDLIAAKNTSWIISVLPTVVLILMCVGFFYFFMRQQNGGKMSQFGKSSMKSGQTDGRKTTFADVAGADEEKEELEEIVEFLKSSKKFTELGARIPHGVLLVGPPGTGKTLLARAVAGEAGVPFFSISGSDFVEMYVGVGASRVRDLFEKAKKNAPSIIFIDEIDAVGRQRGTGLGGGHDEREQTLNQLLVEMDGFSDNQNVIIIAATNRSDVLDPALLRPGRFDRQVVVGRPDVKGREEILKVHAKNKPLGFDVDLSVIAKTTAGFTGADLENLLNEAAILAARKGRKAITSVDIQEATIKVVAGPEKKSKVITEKEKRLTAYHEAGHAIATYYSDTQDPVHEISIIPRGLAGGYTLSLPENDKSYICKSEMIEQIVVLLGGRISESIILNDISTGASNDLERASETARGMVMKYGFSELLGPIVYGSADQQIFLGKDLNQGRNYSEQVAKDIDKEVRKIIDGSYDQCKKILEKHIDKLHVIAKYLMKHEKVDGDTFVKLMKGKISVDYEPNDSASNKRFEVNIENPTIPDSWDASKPDDDAEE